MPSHTFQSPKVKVVKVTSAHRPTKVHDIVVRPKDEDRAKVERPRRSAD